MSGKRNDSSDSEETMDHDDDFSADEGQITMPSKAEILERKKKQRLSMSSRKRTIKKKKAAPTLSKSKTEPIKGWETLLEEEKKEGGSIVDQFGDYVCYLSTINIQKHL